MFQLRFFFFLNLLNAKYTANLCISVVSNSLKKLLLIKGTAASTSYMMTVIIIIIGPSFNEGAKSLHLTWFCYRVNNYSHYFPAVQASYMTFCLYRNTQDEIFFLNIVDFNKQLINNVSSRSRLRSCYSLQAIQNVVYAERLISFIDSAQNII